MHSSQRTGSRERAGSAGLSVAEREEPTRTARKISADMGDRRFDPDNDKGRPDLGTLRVRELVDRISGWCQTGALAGSALRRARRC